MKCVHELATVLFLCDSHLCTMDLKTEVTYRMAELKQSDPKEGPTA